MWYELKLDVLVNPIKEGQGLLYIDNQILIGLASLIYTYLSDVN